MPNTETQVADPKTTVEGEDAQVTDPKVPTTLEEALAELQRKNDNEKRLLQEKADVKKKLSRFEKDTEARDAALLAEQGKFKELFESEKAQREALESRVKEQQVTAAVKTALQEAGARVPDTVLKLIDKTQIKFDEEGAVIVDSVKNAVESLRKVDPVLFGAQHAGLPPAARATEGVTMDTFKTEVAAAKNPKELAAIYEKYKGAGKF
jgi:isoleucyl-tRNA synthetase